jgi:AMP-polyphosphate phosphotransferase
MFEVAELGRKISKDEYEASLPALRTALLKAQARLEGAGFSVVVLVNGVGGRGETTNVLNEWLDTRYLVTEAWSPPTAEERERPAFWRYWMWLPPAGRMGVFLGSWYSQPILDRVHERTTDAELAKELGRIAAFEQTLSDEGTLIVKLWLHLSKRDQKRRLQALEKSPDTRFQVTKDDWRDLRKYDEFRRVSAQVIRETSTGANPWMLIEAADARYRNLSVGQRLVGAIERRLSDEPRRGAMSAPEAPIPDPVTILDTLDMTRKASKEEYDGRMPALRARLARLAARLSRKKRSLIVVFEGPDAAGKGGAIRRLVWALDARQYRVIPVGPPTDEEKAHHYLWRFWRHLPRRGRITVYDRSWYGRVLVERVEGFASEEAWMRAYKEINDFERELTEGGVVLVKFWLNVSSEEQARRLLQREQEPWKQHKVSADDYRNRRKANLYEAAASEMIARNSTEYAPFELVAADDKRYARLEVLERTCARLSASL